MLTEIDHREVLRYLGYRSKEVDTGTQKLIEDCSKELLEKLHPRYVYHYYDIALTPQGVEVKGTTLFLEGQSIVEHLKDSQGVLLFCATLCEEADRLIRRSQVLDAAKGLVMDCCATTAIEQVCDKAEAILRQEYEQKGSYLTSRFSPGYGDLPITIQKDFLQVLDASRKIGVCANQSNILIPRKSVTAVMGVGAFPHHHDKKNCQLCNKKDSCLYRRRSEQDEF